MSDKWHEKHLEMVDAVNNSTTDEQHKAATEKLFGFRWAACHCVGHHLYWELIQHASKAQRRLGVKREMWGGVWLDWKPAPTLTPPPTPRKRRVMSEDKGCPEKTMNESNACFFCGKAGDIVCESAECQTHDKELRDEQDRLHKKQLRDAVRAAISQRCSPEADWRLTAVGRWFYTAKCLFCVFVGWSRNYETTKGYSEVVEVGEYHYAKLYAGWEARWISVGRGVFTQWWYELNVDDAGRCCVDDAGRYDWKAD